MRTLVILAYTILLVSFLTALFVSFSQGDYVWTATDLILAITTFVLVINVIESENPNDKED